MTIYQTLRIAVIVFIIAWCVCLSHLVHCPGEAYYSNTVKPTRLTYLQDGNYSIQGLLMISKMNSDCGQVSRDGLTQMYAIKYAINKFNNHSFYGKRATIGLQLDDDCGQLPTTMARGIEVVSFHRKNSVCRSDFIRCDSKATSLKNVVIREASAVIGTTMSFTTIPLSSLMSLYDIPQVSPSASSRLLSKKDLYKSFFRTIPSDTNQIKAMLDIFERFNWNYIFAIGSDDDYGKLGVSDLKHHTSSRTGDLKICIYKDEYIPYQSDKTESKIREVVMKIKEGSRAKVVVLFLYVQNIGEKIIAEAQKQGIERIWLTSEAWNPAAAQIFSQPGKIALKNQTHGILSVSLKRQALPELKTFIQQQVRQNYKCDKWLQSYVLFRFKCEIEDFKDELFICKNNVKTLKFNDVIEDLSDFPGTVDRLIDATCALALSIQKVLNDSCPNSSIACHVDKLSPSNITQAMHNISFVNDQKQIISFNKGEPTHAFYTIENLVYDNEQLTYKPVGNWSNNGLQLDVQSIQWPYWFNQNTTTKNFPTSRCSQKCQPGHYVVARHGCCWTCHKCLGIRNYTDQEMRSKCDQCGKHYHTVDNKRCVPTEIKWLEINDPAGMSIVIISGIGFIATLAATIFIAKHNALVTRHDPSPPHLLSFVCILLLFTFIYGPLHVIEPRNDLCNFRNGYFFILLMIYCAFVLVKTQAMTSYLRGHADRTFGGRLLATQFLVLLMFFLLELVSVIAWLYVDGPQLDEEPQGEGYVIWKQCEVEFTAARLVSTFIPCIILIIATFCAFRERNHDHSFYEPKFLSFSCIALCIIIVAFLPTFRYVRGIYKAIVLAYTMNVFGFTFLACLMLPKVYVGVMRKRRGGDEYPMKPGVSKHKKKKEEKNKKKHNESANFESPVVEVLKSKTFPEGSETVTDIKMEEKKANGFNHSNGFNNTSNDVKI